MISILICNCADPEKYQCLPNTVKHGKRKVVLSKMKLKTETSL